MKRKNSIALLAALLCAFWAQAQISFSPYSVFGIGDIQSRAMAHQSSMGDVGIGTPSFYHINSMNPALLTYNKLTSFDIALQGESRTSSSSVDSQTNTSGGFKYLSFAFPIIYNRMTTNIGARPYSVVNYNFLTSGTVNGNPNTSTVIERYGEGGLTEFYWSNGIKVAGNLSLGVRASFVFGYMEDQNQLTLESDSLLSQVPIGTYEKTNYKGITYGFGAAYTFDLGESKTITVGAIYDFAHDLKGERLTQQVNGGVDGDILEDRTFDSRFKLPAEYGIGVSYEYQNRIVIGLDASRAEWKSDASFSDLSAQEYRQIYKAGLGVELIPKYNDVDSYFKRVRYRFGVNYEELPYLSAGNKLTDIGINFGWSLPVKAVSSLNMTFKYGRRGTKDDGLVRESYVRFILGMTLNDRWFIRRKYN